MYMKIEGTVSEPKGLVVGRKDPRSRCRRRNGAGLTLFVL